MERRSLEEVEEWVVGLGVNVNESRVSSITSHCLLYCPHVFFSLFQCTAGEVPVKLGLHCSSSNIFTFCCPPAVQPDAA